MDDEEIKNMCNDAVNEAKEACRINGISENLKFPQDFDYSKLGGLLQRIQVGSTSNLEEALKQLQRIAKSVQLVGNDWYSAKTILEKLNTLKRHPGYKRAPRLSLIPFPIRRSAPPRRFMSASDRVKADLEKYKKQGAIKKKMHSAPNIKTSAKGVTLPKHLLPKAYGCSMSAEPVRTTKGHAEEVRSRIKPKDPGAPSTSRKSPITPRKLKSALEAISKKK